MPYIFTGNVALNCHYHSDTTLYTAVARDEDFKDAPYKCVNLGGKIVTTVKERFIADDRHLFRYNNPFYISI